MAQPGELPVAAPAADADAAADGRAATLQELLTGLADGLRTQRQVLEDGALEALAAVSRDVEERYARIEGWSGGIAGLHDDIDRLPEGLRAQLQDCIRRAGEDNRVCGELLRVASQRAAAVRAFHASASESATYAPGDAQGAGVRLSRRA